MNAKSGRSRLNQKELEDLVSMVDFSFNDAPAPEPREIADFNEDGSYDIADLVQMVNYIFGF